MVIILFFRGKTQSVLSFYIWLSKVLGFVGVIGTSCHSKFMCFFYAVRQSLNVIVLKVEITFMCKLK